MAALVALAAPVAGHMALRLGQGYGTALGCAAVQAVAAGIVIRGAVPQRWRWLGFAVPATLLAGMAAAGAGWSAEAGVLAAAGLGHAVLYAVLLAVFAASLRGEALVTTVARRVNPGFHTGMVPYTRKVAWAWCALFAASATLLAVAPVAWRGLVSGWHAAAVAALALSELAIRRWRWRHERPTGLVAMIQGVRALRRDAAGGG